ncbi:MAG: glycosyltransferase, partial [Phycisphaerales bacterium]|nr:glycosyltransferase [Phycisphaerales bacterium]
MTALMATAAALCALALGMTLRNLAVYRRRWTGWRQVASGAEARPLVSVCIPARNEATNIESCVRSVFKQTYAPIEVLVYDDQSTDATPEILLRLAAEDARLVRVPTEPLPPGWNGKQWGCDRMGRIAKGEWLLFTDADVRLDEACVARTLGEAVARGCDLLSTFPRQVLGTVGEALLVPMIHFVLFSYLPMDRM